MYNLGGKVAMVTGTSNKRTIGRSLALRLAREGADIVTTDKYKAPEDFDSWDKKEGWRGLDSLVEEIEALGCRALAVHADLTSSREVDEMVGMTVKKLGRIDILVNNAGLTSRDIGPTPVVDMREEVWVKTIAVNLTGTFLMCRAVARQMIKQGQGGKIINMSSILGKTAAPCQAPYTASKFGVIGLTQTLALELAPHKINVNAVCPGLIASWATRGQAYNEAVSQGLSEEEAITKVDSERGSIQRIPLGRTGRLDDVANVVAFLASAQSDFMTGQAINVTGGALMVH